MYIIGITGSTGSGKTTAMQALQTFGALALDCDEIYHELLSSNPDMKEEIEARFDNILTEGKIDRKKLGAIVWNEPVALKDLNEITHKFVSSELDHHIASFEAQGGNLAAIDAIALIESGQSRRCDIVVGVLAPEEKRLSRIMKRDSLTAELAQMRIDAQQRDSFYRENCDHILENIYDTQEKFENKCKEFFKEILMKNQENSGKLTSKTIKQGE